MEYQLDSKRDYCYTGLWKTLVMSGHIPEKDKKTLCMKSGCICAIPTCRRKLIVEKKENDEVSIVAQMAHIKGENVGSARYDPKIDPSKLNRYDNLILVCNVCHKMIDDQVNEYTVEKLIAIKAEHEKWFDQIIEREIPNVTFAELEVITKFLVSDIPNYEEDYRIINPVDKIKKNELSESVSRLIVMGMTQVKLVEQYIDTNLDTDFGERLRDGFVKEYDRLKNKEKLKGDEMFYSMLAFAGGMVSDAKRSSAGLAVTVYLFETCEIFEK